MGVVARKTFSHTPDEAMSDGLAKACGLGKMYSVEENISHFIYTDASDDACGAQLSQEHDGTEFPVAFLSHTFTETQHK